VEQTGLGSNFLQLAQVLFQNAANPLTARVSGASAHSPYPPSVERLRLFFEGGVANLLLDPSECRMRGIPAMGWSDACHENWLFPDGVRRPVYLQVGYE